MKVIDGVFQLKIPIPDNPLGHVNTYLIEGEDGYTLVDCGWNTPEALQSMERQLAEIGRSMKDIVSIVVTHIHPDHFGLAGKIKAVSNAQVMLHRVEEPLVISRYVNPEPLLRLLSRWLLTHGVPENEAPRLQTASMEALQYVSLTRPDKLLHGGEQLSVGDFTLKVLWTPGHSPGHVCLYEPQRKILFSGDHVLPVITPNVSLNPEVSQNPLADYVQALRAVQQLEVGLVLPAHEHIFSDLGKRAQEILDHHEERMEAIKKAMEGQPRTAYQIARQIPWMSGEGAWEAFSAWDRRAAVMETLAHLEFMRAEGRAASVSKNGAFYFAAL